MFWRLFISLSKACQFPRLQPSQLSLFTPRILFEGKHLVRKGQILRMFTLVQNHRKHQTNQEKSLANHQKKNKTKHMHQQNNPGKQKATVHPSCGRILVLLGPQQALVFHLTVSECVYTDSLDTQAYGKVNH